MDDIIEVTRKSEDELARLRGALSGLAKDVDVLMQNGPFYAPEHTSGYRYWACCEGGEDFHARNCPYEATWDSLGLALVALTPKEGDDNE